ncbi:MULTISPECIES: hypothetical protein [unclassified Lysobacter]|uniref:hypothetical protein n=1 Tax=unclassified Lysobacter TaxID=2635362 RepID=UPI001C23C528|nr:hypothetical protein [Lysobacter sp. MMG2]MBU8975444.1 hypothetical protein [Lysobacter sp. MMG2]
MHPILVTLLVVGAGDYTPPPPEAPEWAYYQCMIENSSKYARKTSLAEEAITAARASCHSLREELLARLYMDAYEFQNSESSKRSSAHLLRRIDGQLYPFFVKAALDSK